MRLKGKRIFIVEDNMSNLTINTIAKKGQKKAGFSGKVMSLTTAQDLKAYERDYNTDPLPGAVSVENTVKAVVPYCAGVTVYERSGHDAGVIALDGGRGQLPNDTTLVSDAVGLGRATVDGDTDAFTRP